MAAVCQLKGALRVVLRSLVVFTLVFGLCCDAVDGVQLPAHWGEAAECAASKPRDDFSPEVSLLDVWAGVSSFSTALQ